MNSAVTFTQSVRQSIIQSLEKDRVRLLSSIESMESANAFALENSHKTPCLTYKGMDLYQTYYQAVVTTKAVLELKRIGNEVNDVIRDLPEESTLKPVFETIGLTYPGSSNGWLKESIENVRTSIRVAMYRALDE
jgi:hypothetical protein